MSNLYDALIKNLLFKLDAETAHGISIKALKAGLYPRIDGALDPRLAMRVAGLDFPNPLGMAAGYDKGGEVPDALMKMGFGHSEAGTITPAPQPGNDKPRVFRLVEDRAVINRLGFNSAGHDVVRNNLLKRQGNGLVGVNIGANKTSEDFGADYVAGIAAFADIARYFTINISSPNTPGLRALQDADPLADLLSRVSDARIKHNAQSIPLFLKIAPDLDEGEMDAISKVLKKSSFDALIVSNTTLSREGLTSASKSQAGGLSGKPLFERSTIVLAKMHQRLDGSLPLIGVGGVDDADSAFTKIEAGASLVQLYSGLIYQGPELPKQILSGLSSRLDQESIENLCEIVGRKSEEWAGKPLN